MNAIPSVSFDNASIGTQQSALDNITKAEINIAIQQRDVTFLQEELELLMQQARAFKKSGSIAEISVALEQYLHEQALNCPMTLKDIEKQLHLFSRISGEESLRILLTTVHTNMCRRFHTDINALRLLCTYVGQGTMWLPNEVVNEKAFIMGGDNEQIVKDKRHIQQAGTGDIVLLKGALYPQGEAIVHRSPTIEESGETRLLLRIDTNVFLNL